MSDYRLVWHEISLCSAFCTVHVGFCDCLSFLKPYQQFCDIYFVERSPIIKLTLMSQYPTRAEECFLCRFISSSYANIWPIFSWRRRSLFCSFCLFAKLCPNYGLIDGLMKRFRSLALSKSHSCREIRRLVSIFDIFAEENAESLRGNLNSTDVFVWHAVNLANNRTCMDFRWRHCFGWELPLSDDPQIVGDSLPLNSRSAAVEGGVIKVHAYLTSIAI